MLTREALEAALPLTEQLDARGMYLQPIPETPVGVLVKATRSSDKCNVPLDGGGFQPDLMNIEFLANAQPSDGTLNEHDCAMDSIVSVAIAKVQDHIAFAKTVVAPAVEDLVERVRAGLAGLAPSSLLGMEVKVVEAPELLASPAFQSAIRKYQDTPMLEPRMIVRMPEMPAADIIENMSAGGAGANAEIKAWAAAKGDAWIEQLWRDVFQVHPGDKAVAFQRYLSGEDGVDAAIGVFLLARRLIEAIPDGVEMNLRTLQECLADFRNQAAARLCRALDEQANAEKTGLLVRKQTKNTAWVNGSVYRKWVEKGGSNETLFGNMIAAKPAYVVSDFEARGAEIKAGWDKHAALTATVEAGRRFVRTKELLAACFEEQVNQVAEGDASLSGSRMEIKRLFNDLLEGVREDDLNDFYGCVLKLLCRSRFVRTDAERILTGIERAKRDNPQLDVREAAAISVIQYIAWWVSTQFRVVVL